MDGDRSEPQQHSFKPHSQRMTNKQAVDLRKQAVMGQASAATQHHHLHAVQEDAMDSSVEECSKLSLASSSGASGPHVSTTRHKVTLGSWDAYWDSRQAVEVPGRGSFMTYQAGYSGAVVFCLHGGGYTGLTWSLVAKQLKQQYRVFAMDLRGHGSSTTADDADLSAETMTQDIVAVWQQVFGGSSSSSSSSSSSERVPTLLVGHSMGGALAVWAAASKQITGLDGVVVIDVVEGTAIAALPHMTAVLAARPPGFPSLEVACDWAVRTATCKNREMAGVSLPSQLKPVEDGTWQWRTNLAASSPYWRGWYEGLSDAFLGLPVPKMLLLAGTDRLDKSLTIGQMQGKFQLVLMPTAGHAIQEDEPSKTAEYLQQFLHRFRIGEPPMVIPKARPGVRPVLPVVGGPLHAAAAAVAGASVAGTTAMPAAVATVASHAQHQQQPQQQQQCEQHTADMGEDVMQH